MRGLLLAATLSLFSITLTAADNPFIGAWKLNVAKSKGTPGTISKEETVVFTTEGDAVKRTVTGIDADGQKLDMSAHHSLGRDGTQSRWAGGTGHDCSEIRK